MDLPGGSVVKNLPCQCRRSRFNPCQEDLLEKEMATQSSILAWKIPWTEEPGRLQSIGSQRVRHDSNNLSDTLEFCLTILCQFFSPWPQSEISIFTFIPLNFNKFSHPINVSIKFSSLIQSCPTLCDPMNRTTPGLPLHHQLPESTQTHVHWVSDAI